MATAYSDPYGSFTVQEGSGSSDHVAPGHYEFTLAGFDFDQYDGTSKTPACTRVILSLSVHSASTGDTGTVIDRICLADNWAWKLTSFFRSIGALTDKFKAGDEFPMDWDGAVGLSGECDIKDNTFTGRDGAQVTNSQVSRYHKKSLKPIADDEEF